MVSDAVVGPIISPYFISQVSRPHLFFSSCLLLCKVFSMEHLVHSWSKAFQSFQFVCCLVSGILTLSHYTSRNMHSSASWVSFINVLTASSLRSICVDSNFFHIKSEFIGNFWHHDHNSSTTVDAACLFCFRDPLNFMRPRFMFQVFLNVSSCYLKLARLATPSDTYIRLDVNLLQSPPHQSTVVFVHLT